MAKNLKLAPSQQPKQQKNQRQRSSNNAKEIAGKQRGLGRGLSSLLGDAVVAAAANSTEPAAAAAVTGLTEILIEWINVGPWQPRRKFDQVALKELAESIQSKGLVQPVLVRPSAKSQNRYEPIAGVAAGGLHRWRRSTRFRNHPGIFG